MSHIPDYNQPGHVCPSTGRKAITAEDYCKLDDVIAYAYNPESASRGLDPWRMLEGVDQQRGGELCDLHYVDGGWLPGCPVTTIVYVQAEPGQAQPNQLRHQARWGTTFSVHKNLEEAVQIVRPGSLSLERFAADCIEFGGWHGTQIHGDLVSFRGYDTVSCLIESGLGCCPSMHEGFRCSLLHGHIGAHMLGVPGRERLRWVTRCPAGSCDYHQNSADGTTRLVWQECVNCGHMKP